MPVRDEPSSLQHPLADELDLVRVLHALADATRLQIVTELARDGERSCGTFTVSVRPSTLSHHFRVLREAGVIQQVQAGRERRTSLRADDLELAFPGLLSTVLDALRQGR